MQDMVQLITFVEACIPDSDISVLEKALIIHYERLYQESGYHKQFTATYDTALQNIRSRLPRDHQINIETTRDSSAKQLLLRGTQ